MLRCAFEVIVGVDDDGGGGRGCMNLDKRSSETESHSRLMHLGFLSMVWLDS